MKRILFGLIYSNDLFLLVSPYFIHAQTCLHLFKEQGLAIEFTKILSAPTPDDVRLLESEVNRLHKKYGQLDEESIESSVESSLYALLVRNNKLAAIPKSPFGKLTEIERYVIGEYVEWGYQEFNRFLATRKLEAFNNDSDQVVDSVTQAKVRTLAAALKKLPQYEGLVLRGEVQPINSELELKKKLSYLRKGQIFLAKNFLSSSADRSADAENQYGQLLIQYKIESKNGRFIGPMSSRFYEHEVLFQPYTQFLVTDIQKVEIDINDPARRFQYIIMMKEI